MSQSREAQFSIDIDLSQSCKLAQDPDAVLSKAYKDCFCRCGVMLRNPIKLNPCGHKVCPNCARVCDSCPFCHSPVDYKREDTSFSKELQQPNYSCPNSSKTNTKLGCRFTGSLESVRNHMINDCQWAMLVCPNSKYGCREQVPRGEIRKHVRGCVCSPSVCRFCGQGISKNDIFRHEKECQTRYARCQFCGEMVLKSMSSEHIEQECGKKPTVCPIAYCGAQLKKGELQSHLMADGVTLKKHNQALARLMVETASGIEEIREIISELRNSVVAKKQRLQQLDEIIAEATEQLEGTNGMEEGGSPGQSNPSSPSGLQDFSQYDQSEAFEALQRRFETVLAERDIELKRLELEAAVGSE